MDLKTFLRKFKPELTALNTLITSQATHCLIVSPDIAILNFIVTNLSKLVKPPFNSISINPVGPPSNGTLAALHIKPTCAFQNEIYTFLEHSQQQSESFMIFYSSRIDVVMNMEKRVRSRFNNEIVYFKPMPQDPKNMYEHAYAINPTLQNTLNTQTMNNCKFDQIRMVDIYKMLSPVHLVLLLVAKRENVAFNSVLSKFKLFCLYTPELRKVESMIVYDAFNDLMAFKLVSKRFCGDWDGFAEFVRSESPVFVRSLMYNI